MADPTQHDSVETGRAVQESGENVGLVVNAQYAKDLSFENPAPIDNLLQQEGDVSTDVNIEVSCQGLQENIFEVSLTVKGHVTRGEQTIYLVELVYAGVFTLTGIPEDMMQFVLFIECPRLLFPFARNLITQVTQESGFPPLYLKPVDFGELLQQKMAEEGEKIPSAPVQGHA